MGSKLPTTPAQKGLSDHVGPVDELVMQSLDEEAWIEVIQKMDSVYSDLIESQVDVEEKNAKLENAQKFIRSILSSMTDVLIVTDMKGIIQRVNTAMANIVGKSEKQMVGDSLLSYFEESSLAAVDAFFEMVHSQETILDSEISLIGENDVLVPLSVNCSTHYDNKGRLVGVVLIGRPIGELRRAYTELDDAHQNLHMAQEQLVLSEKMVALGRLVAGVAHELNNPISFVFGNMHALQRYGANITQYLQALDSDLSAQELKALRAQLKIDKIARDIAPLVDGTLEGAERVRDIVQDLRRFSSAQEQPREDVDLPTILRTATKWVSTTARVRPEVDFQLEEPLSVVAHKGHIHQIVVNLVQNSIDVMADSPSPRLEIGCRLEGDAVKAWVRDFGPGISDEDMPNIFEPFYTTKPIGQGTGLGLSVSYRMAEEQGGKLSAENHPDGGAIFTLTLPMEVKNDE